MYFSRIRFRPDLSSGEIARIHCSNPYEEHQQLWNLFTGDPNAQRDFLFRAEPDHFFIVSEREPHDHQGIWQIESKQYDPKPILGGRYRFMLRVNPIVTRKDSEGKAHRHDVVMNAKTKIGFATLSDKEKPPLNLLIADAGLQWIKKREKNHGFVVDESCLLVSGYQQHRIRKRGKSKPISYSTLDFSGSLNLTDTEKLRQALVVGIGPSKAFGCGLLLIRRV